ncbi:ferritin-like domain-containing protein [Arenibaculum pallidiluteum]|uniref:ferritin-like domain-containing protein n=1 Tax=Arenibaculum pallidiluteum TaxID=2812559 RepID=UPI001A971840|nr:ferritin-like domain-containing protein [Arenibaculum pallidiluteum]
MLPFHGHSRTFRALVPTRDDMPDARRRALLRGIVRQGVSVPVACILIGSGTRGPAAALAADGQPPGPPPGHARSAMPRMLVRDFADPYLELVRLLREAAEIEHALMVQYLYAAFSVRPAYQGIVGHGDPNAETLLGVAVQEMQHLGAVNRLLVEIGASPHLERQDFPYEPDIYPFPFVLEPLSRASLAKYVYCEAPADFAPVGAGPEEEARFRRDIDAFLGAGVRPNHIGGLYGTLMDVLKELPAERVAGRDAWLDELARISDEGEIEHYAFFRSLFMGRHAGFGGVERVWDRDPADPLYPAHPLPVAPTAFLGHVGQIRDAEAQGLAWLGNLHYWITLCLLDISYRTGSEEALDLARGQMLGPLWSLARHMPTLGAALAFDSLSMGYAPGTTPEHSQAFVLHLAREAGRLAEGLRHSLPTDYPQETNLLTATALKGDPLRGETRRL